MCIAAWLTDEDNDGDNTATDDMTADAAGNNSVVLPTLRRVGVASSGRVSPTWRGSIAHGIHANGSMVTTDEWTRRFHALAVPTLTITDDANFKNATTTSTTASAGTIIETGRIKPMPATRICVTDAEQLLDDFIDTLDTI